MVRIIITLLIDPAKLETPWVKISFPFKNLNIEEGKGRGCGQGKCLRKSNALRKNNEIIILVNFFC